jgi:diguanylate cyclase (GGDEF)-like protein
VSDEAQSADWKALSFKQFTGLLSLATLLIYSAFALFSYQQYQTTVDDIHQAELASAQSELKITLQKALGDLQQGVDELAQWDEIFQQISDPLYFSYWYGHRIIDSSALDKRFDEMMLYDAQGKALDKQHKLKLPAQIDTDYRITRFDVLDNGDVRITFIKPLQRENSNKIAGYLALNASLLKAIRRINSFDLVNIKSLRFEPAQVNNLSDLSNHARFLLIQSRHSRLLDDLVVQLIVSLGLFIVVPTLFLLIFSMTLVGQSVRRLPRVIDDLRNPDDTSRMVGGRNKSIFPEFQLAEVQHAENSLTEYHRELSRTTDVLDDKNRELWKMAHHDALTGVCNRRAFDDYLGSLNNRATSVAVQTHRLMLGDINHFKAINDTYGHTTGDRVLAIISQCLDDGLRSSDRLFRLGGDEFACVLINCNDEQALQVAQRCQQMIRQYPFAVELGMKEPVRISIGLSQNSLKGSNKLSIKQLLQQADIAMYASKRPGNPTINFYQPDMLAESVGVYSNEMNDAVNRMIEKGQGIVMHYQPIKRLNCLDDVYFEALLRLEYQGRVIFPGEIFPVVESHRLEIEVDRLIVTQILCDLQKGLIPIGTGVSINLSAQSVIHHDVLDWMSVFKPFFKQYKLIIEVTETSLICQMDAASQNLTALRKMGFLVALDDFGSGYSSLRYLTGMPVDIVKFDISMTRALNDPAQATMVRHLAAMIREAGYEIVAEGIEDEATLQRVNRCGFDFGQGFLLGKPERLKTSGETLKAG